MCAVLERVYSVEMGQFESFLDCESTSIGGHIHCWGNCGDSIKATLIRRSMERCEMRFVLVDAIFVDGSARTLFNDVLEGLEEDDFEAGEANGDHCEFEELANVGDDFGRFQQRLSALSKTLKETGKSSGMIVVVVENAGFLRKFPPAFLTAVLRLPDQLRFLKFVTVGRNSWLQFSTADFPSNIDAISDPIEIAFRSPNKDALCDILCERWDTVSYPISTRALHKSLTLLLDIAYAICRDVDRLLLLGEFIWKENRALFSTPTSETTASDFKAPSTWLTAIRDGCTRFLGSLGAGGNRGKSPTSRGRDNADLLLPVHVRVLLIAAYCASYNPPKSDRRFFSKSHVKQRRRATVGRPPAGGPANAHEIGPRPFDLQRLTFIFRALVEKFGMLKNAERCAPTIPSLVAGLVRDRLLTRVSVVANLDECRLRCLASFECVQKMARSLGEDVVVTDFLFDFAGK